MLRWVGVGFGYASVTESHSLLSLFANAHPDEAVYRSLAIEEFALLDAYLKSRHDTGTDYLI